MVCFVLLQNRGQSGSRYMDIDVYLAYKQCSLSLHFLSGPSPGEDTSTELCRIVGIESTECL